MNTSWLDDNNPRPNVIYYPQYLQRVTHMEQIRFYRTSPSIPIVYSRTLLNWILGGPSNYFTVFRITYIHCIETKKDFWSRGKQLFLYIRHATISEFAIAGFYCILSPPYLFFWSHPDCWSIQCGFDTKYWHVLPYVNSNEGFTS